MFSRRGRQGCRPQALGASAVVIESSSSDSTPKEPRTPTAPRHVRKPWAAPKNYQAWMEDSGSRSVRHCSANLLTPTRSDGALQSEERREWEPIPLKQAVWQRPAEHEEPVCSKLSWRPSVCSTTSWRQGSLRSVSGAPSFARKQLSWKSDASGDCVVAILSGQGTLDAPRQHRSESGAPHFARKQLSLRSEGAMDSPMKFRSHSKCMNVQRVWSIPGSRRTAAVDLDLPQSPTGSEPSRRGALKSSFSNLMCRKKSSTLVEPFAQKDAPEDPRCDLAPASSRVARLHVPVGRHASCPSLSMPC